MWTCRTSQRPNFPILCDCNCRTFLILNLRLHYILCEFFPRRNDGLVVVVNTCWNRIRVWLDLCNWQFINIHPRSNFPVFSFWPVGVCRLKLCLHISFNSRYPSLSMIVWLVSGWLLQVDDINLDSWRCIIVLWFDLI